MHPGFLRFPGGCIVEGRQLATRYRWKTTVGDIAQRRTIINRWNDEFDFRPAPDYFQSFWLGFYEYFQLAEDIGAKPLPILNCGMACEFNTNETAALDQLDEYVRDALDRSGPKVFAGEYAAQTVGTTSAENRNNWKAAISEAAFMTGLERNGDVVQMASYAPLMAHVYAWQWKPDEIWFDNLRSYGTPNYYVQKVFATNAGSRTLPSTPQAMDGIYTSAMLDERSHELIVKAVNVSAESRAAEIELNGLDVSGPAKVTTLRPNRRLKTALSIPQRWLHCRRQWRCNQGKLQRI